MLHSPILKRTQTRLPRTNRPILLHLTLHIPIPNQTLNTPIRNPIRPQKRNNRPDPTITTKRLQNRQTPHILRNRPHHIIGNLELRTKTLTGLSPQTPMNTINHIIIQSWHTINYNQQATTKQPQINLFGNQQPNTDTRLHPLLRACRKVLGAIKHWLSGDEPSFASRIASACPTADAATPGRTLLRPHTIGA